MIRKLTAQRIIIAIAALVITAIACNSPTAAEPTPHIMGNPSSPVPEATTAPTAEPTTAAVEATTAPTEQPPDAPAPNAEFEGISFHFEPALVSSWTGAITDVPAADDFFPIPSHYRIRLEGYPVQGNWEAFIEVYPVDNLQGQNESFVPIHDALKALLEARPAEIPDDLPYMPPFYEGGFSFNSNKMYLNFQNGSGVRYVTQFYHAFLYVNNLDLVYVYQGLTNDGLYYVSVMLPVTHPSLPNDSDWENDPNFDPSTSMNDMDAYLDPIVTTLNEDPAGFNPSLEALDVMVQSLRVEPAR